MKTPIIAIAAAAAITGMASADIVNGAFDGGSTAGWNQFGGAEGAYNVNFAGGDMAWAVVAYGTFGGVPNFSGYSQDLGVTGDYAEGDTISFGGDMYIEDAKRLYGGNTANVQLNFWYGAAGTDYGFSVVAGTLDTNSARDFLHSFSMDYVLDAGAASATRISLDFTYVQAEIAPEGTENGAAWGSNFSGSIVPAPGALALLGVAGLAGRRRRG
ncbi:MAG: hypothetical protein GY895_14355 [Phycisphaera sp.]|nr:hypothetical protein [Phycisphaera sp.]